ncbi:hypothetical protein MHY30_13355 [Microbacterium sp. ACRRU]|uniref:hypothetical protein n=1 Tax=Microbacterium sp. ACRRU TaxID=2918204 RepID=UPI001EF584C0|nr:hypothetical protein [Microbacterium sp. ACRRU]MCG7418493.1 hypothetical protein [Microbacterium sp. ACRRU]
MTAQSRPRAAVAVLAAWVCAVALLVAVPVALPATVAPVASASAANAADWNPGNIIDDALFYDGAVMGSPAIQAFMEQRVKQCRSGYTCLKDYRQNTDNRPADKYCNGYSGAANESASTIIDKVARSCGISQKALLVLLEKEQSLVTSTAPSAWSYSAATGQGCPDTAPCDPQTQGFFYQVYYAARQFEIYRLNPTWWGYQSGRWNNILYNPTTSCGTQRVYIENQATAGLYIYTPYVPNAAALRNLYGTGDSCSAYGNRNFWRLYTDWFGSTRAAGRPIGAIDAVDAYPGGVQVRGWTIDPDTVDPIRVRVDIGGVATTVTADVDRPDLLGPYPASGSRHGFDARIPVTQGGSGQVCLTALNTGSGQDTSMGCRDVPFYTGSPVGAIDSVKAVSGSVTVSGWALDPDTASSIPVHAYVDGVSTALLADRDRPDLAAHYPVHGTAHGYSATLKVPLDAKQICLYGVNTGRGENTTLGCRSIMTPAPKDLGRAPIGYVDDVEVAGLTARVRGWALDPDTAGRIPVHIYVAGAGRAITADLARPDVAGAYPAYGERHGFSDVVDLPAGQSTVCAYAINTSGENTTLGCRTVTGGDQGRAPIGNFESADVSGRTATVVGWAIDPDTIRPIGVRISVDDVSTKVTAQTQRPDVEYFYPLYGAAHGFSRTVDIPVGPSRICVSAVNTSGPDTDLGCRGVGTRDEGRAPIGSLDGVTVSGTSAAIRGWAIDPDTARPIPVHVYVDGAGIALTADTWRPDVGAAYPLYGSSHGFEGSVRIPVGPSRLCVYAINTSGPNPTIGCREVTGVAGAPIGRLDDVTASPGALTVRGWAFDPDVVGAVDVRVAVDGTSYTVRAGSPRSDVAAAFPLAGPNHGFEQRIPMAKGSYNVCASVSDNTGGLSVPLGCRGIVVP